MPEGRKSRSWTHEETEAARKHAEAVGFDDVYVTSDGGVFGITVESEHVRGEDKYFGRWVCVFCGHRGGSSRVCDSADEAQMAARGNAAHRCHPSNTESVE